MSTTTPNMGLTKPDVGASIGTWATELNAALDTTDEHDHTPGKGPLVPTAGINVNADLSFAGFGATGIKVADLAAVLASSVSGYPTSLFCNSADNELYWRTAGGVNVQLTSGNSLNAALLGGFTGDYGSGGSQANFNSGTAIYNFLRAANHRANLDTADIRLFQGTSGITAAVKIKSPNALAGSYDWVFPTGLPGSQQILQISSAGQVIASSTLASNQSVAVSGTGRYKHGTRTLVLAGAEATILAGSSINTGTLGLSITTSAALNAMWGIAGLIESGKRLTGYRAHVTDNATGTTTLSFDLFTKTGTTASGVAGEGVISAGNGTLQTLSHTMTTPITMAAGTALMLACASSASNACAVHWVEFSFDDP